MRQHPPDRTTIGVAVGVGVDVAVEVGVGVYAPGSALLLPCPPVDSQDLAAWNERIGFAENSGDREWLSTILAPRLAFLQKVKAGGTRETRSIEPIQLFGDRAVVKCIVTVGDQEFHNLRLFVRREGQ